MELPVLPPAHGKGARESPRVLQTALTILAWMPAWPLGPADSQYLLPQQAIQILVVLTRIHYFSGFCGLVGGVPAGPATAFNWGDR